MNDNQAVNQFLDGIAWADECTVLESGDGRHRLLTPHFVLVPSVWWNIFDEEDTEAIALSQRYDVEPGVLLYGSPSPNREEFRIITRERAVCSSFVIWWLGDSNQVHWNELLGEVFPVLAKEQIQGRRVIK